MLHAAGVCGTLALREWMRESIARAGLRILGGLTALGAVALAAG